MAGLTQITPFVRCRALEPQIAFYRDRLGFTVGFRDGNHAFLHRDAVAIRLIEVGETPEPAGTELSFYIDVDDIDQIYARMAPQLSTLPKGRVRPPFNQPYGQREFHVLDEDGALVFFGEKIKDIPPGE